MMSDVMNQRDESKTKTKKQTKTNGGLIDENKHKNPCKKKTFVIREVTKQGAVK